METEPKPWWASKTIWVNVVGLGALIAARWGLEITEAMQAEVVGAVLAIINIGLRAVTTRPIGR